MKLKLVYNSEDDIPDGYAALYTETDGKWHLTGIQGMKTQADIDKLNESVTKEREAHKKTKDKLAKLGGADVDIDELVTKLDDYDDMKLRAEAAGDGKVDDAKIEEIVEARVTRRLRPVERERDQYKSRVTELEGENGELKGTISTGSIEGTLRKLATSEKVIDSAVDDILDKSHIFEVAEDGAIVTKSGVRNVEAGVEASVWIEDMKEKRPHWWPASEGGGAGGGGDGKGGGSNPWGKDSWDMEAQGAMVRSDRPKAERMAKAAGSKIGATKPA